MIKSLLSFILISFSTALCWSIDIEYPKLEILGILPIGMDNGALRLNIGEPYEPEAPTQILVNDYGNILICDYYQGIVIYDSNLKYITTLNPSIYTRMALSQNLLIAWNTDSSIKGIKIWKYIEGKYVCIDQIDDRIGGGQEIYVSAPYIFAFGNDNKLYGYEVENNHLTIINDSDLLLKLKIKKLEVQSNILYHETIGPLSSHAEDFFYLTSKEELVYAFTNSGRDKVNFAVSNIFGIDTKGNRYLYYARNSRFRIAICDQYGKLSKSYKLFQDGDSIKMSMPCLLSDGSILFLTSANDGHKVYKILHF
jgi:uncharacterized protein YuzE